MLQTLRQIVRVGIKTEAAPKPADDNIVVARLQAEILRTLGRALTIRHALTSASTRHSPPTSTSSARPPINGLGPGSP